MPVLTQTPEWVALEQHWEAVSRIHMRRLFDEDPSRFETFSEQFEDILLDYSKNRITKRTMKLLMALARRCDVAGWRDRMFRGEKINTTEDRSVLHVALRNRSNRPILVDGEDVMPRVNAVLAHMSPGT